MNGENRIKYDVIFAVTFANGKNDVNSNPRTGNSYDILAYHFVKLFDLRRYSCCASSRAILSNISKSSLLTSLRGLFSDSRYCARRICISRPRNIASPLLNMSNVNEYHFCNALFTTSSLKNG